MPVLVKYGSCIMTIVNRTIYIAAILLVALVLPIHAAEYRGIGVSRDAVNTMLQEEGLNPTFNKFPDLEGEPVTESTVWNPYINFQMIGPDEELTEVTLTVRPSTNENDAYWQGYVSLWLLAAIFPEWQNREEWLNRAIVSGERIEFARDGLNVYVIPPEDFALWSLVISGQEIE